ncbi:MAG: polysaccharide biosynthesis/export protein [Betaproteobacteria bacterium]|jgi:polysaccharide export outer membrane protein|nr:polysaccharide biosynthesis/export protein [Betaproteobacteria bacterium]
MKRILITLALLATALPLNAQQAQQAADKLGAGDGVRVTVFQQPDLTTEGRVSDRGTISLPLVGEVKVGGTTTSEAGNRIADAYKNGKYLRTPQVTVALTAVRSRQVSVLGMVARPGRYVLEEAKPGISDVIAAAGGIAAGGNENVTVIRNGESQKVSSLAKDFELQSGDTLYVDRGPTFYIYGEVTRAGAYPVQPGLTVMQAISLSGGITPRGSERRLKMRRPGPDGQVVETDAKLQDTVKADDVIFVREALF